MSPTTIIALLEALLNLGPRIPALITGVQTAIDLLKAGRAPTPEEQAAVDAALDAANTALQNS